MSTLFLLFLFFTGLAAQSLLRVVRNRVFPADDFLLPPNTAACRRIGQSSLALCSKYNASNLAGCWCDCDRPSEKFTFFEQSYACLKASVARQWAGMRILEFI